MTGGRFEWKGGELFVTRSGYTGEDGFEISVHESQADALARALLAQPEVKPVGLGARNSLRLEAGLCLYGNDIDTTTTPVEAALNWAIQKVRRTGGARAGGFPGRGQGARRSCRARVPLERKRVGLVALERVPVREHTELQRCGRDGASAKSPAACSAPPSTSRWRWAMSPPHLAAPGTRLDAIVRGKPVPMEVARMPFVPNRYYRG